MKGMPINQISDKEWLANSECAGNMSIFKVVIEKLPKADSYS